MVIREDSKEAKNSTIEISFTVNGLKERKDIRNFLLEKWKKEVPKTQYRYFVETLNNEERLYIERPGRLNKGCDFVIYIENLFQYKNGNDKPPSHKNLFDDLKNKKSCLGIKSWKQLISSIEAIYNMDSYRVSQDYKEEIDSIPPMNLQQIQLLCKWFFIEQDLTYWSGKGRTMLWEAIKKLNT